MSQTSGQDKNEGASGEPASAPSGGAEADETSPTTMPIVLEDDAAAQNAEELDTDVLEPLGETTTGELAGDGFETLALEVDNEDLTDPMRQVSDLRQTAVDEKTRVIGALDVDERQQPELELESPYAAELLRRTGEQYGLEERTGEPVDPFEMTGFYLEDARSSDPLTRATELVCLALTDAWRGQHERALSICERLLEHFPAFVPAIKLAKLLSERQRRWVEVAQWCEREAEETVCARIAFENRAAAARVQQERLGDFEAARDQFEALLDEDPTHADAFAKLKPLLLQRGEVERLLELYVARLAHTDGVEHKKTLLNEMADIALHRARDMEGAVEYFRRSLDIEPEQLRTLRILAEPAPDGRRLRACGARGGVAALSRAVARRRGGRSPRDRRRSGRGRGPRGTVVSDASGTALELAVGWPTLFGVAVDQVREVDHLEGGSRLTIDAGNASTARLLVDRRWRESFEPTALLAELGVELAARTLGLGAWLELDRGARSRAFEGLVGRLVPGWGGADGAAAGEEAFDAGALDRWVDERDEPQLVRLAEEVAGRASRRAVEPQFRLVELAVERLGCVVLDDPYRYLPHTRRLGADEGLLRQPWSFVIGPTAARIRRDIGVAVQQRAE